MGKSPSNDDTDQTNSPPSQSSQISSQQDRDETRDIPNIGSELDSNSLAQSLRNLGSGGNVGVSEGISYGLGLIVYIIGLLLITTILTGLGGGFLSATGAVNNIVISSLIGLIGLVLFLIGLVFFFAGFAGLQYKIIADAVSRGTDTE